MCHLLARIPGRQLDSPLDYLLPCFPPRMH
ncbi:hypothetical protein Ahy_A01g003742 isoform B [Arachis hypogaea]|uniref:Uncharacterized protein n=1 Tax=Arachis hypogaea TaxID=3818 RepID=A0A445ETR8_ARAHY|nr:hypothetical protein Ahy_A01g003742 isoform B [Arachis hypogaea]